MSADLRDKQCFVSRGLKLAAVIALGAFAGCAKDPTTIVVSLGIDSTVPPLLILGVDVVSNADPTLTASSRFTSPEPGDAGDRPGPFYFPLLLPVTVDASFAGPVTLTVEGLDWTSYAVIATGSTTAGAVAQQSTSADIVLTATGAPAGDGGGDASLGDAGHD
jgi:hypothetical protein